MEVACWIVTVPPLQAPSPCEAEYGLDDKRKREKKGKERTCFEILWIFVDLLILLRLEMQNNSIGRWVLQSEHVPG